MRLGPIVGEKQDPAAVTKAPKLTKDAGLIDWSKPSEVVCRQIRAMQPWPTAYTYLHRQGKAPLRTIVCRAITVASESGPEIEAKQPGALELGPLGALIAQTGRSCVQILELQLAGKKRQSAAEFLRGYPVTPGDRFGPET
jgi:methionyl-tRNA formyltransferase